MFEIEDLAESDQFLNVLYWGEPGSGKTTAMASMARLGLTFILDFESGTRRSALASRGIPVENIKRVRCRTYEDVDAFYRSAASKLEQDPGSIVGIGIDSVSEMSKKFTENLTRGRYEKRTKAGMVDDEFDIQLEEHGRSTEQLRRMARNFRDLPCHTVFTALEKRDKDNDGAVYYRPSLGPKFANDLMSFVNVVVHTDLKKDSDDNLVRVGYTQPHGKYRSKDNTGMLPEFMIDPTFDRIHAVVTGELRSEDVDYTQEGS